VCERPTTGVVEAVENSDEEHDMADDLTNRGPRDRTLINTTEEHEIRYWTKELRVSEVELKRLVSIYGTSVDMVRAAIRK
jgi:hypothetical protein